MSEQSSRKAKVVGNMKQTIFLEIINGVLDFDQICTKPVHSWVLEMKVECRCNIVFCENLVLIMSPDPYFTSFLFLGFHAAVEGVGRKTLRN